MTRTVIALSVGILVTLAGRTGAAHGWGDVGHMMVAHVAYHDLTPSTRARVNALLRLNPRHAEWVAWLPAAVSDLDRDLRVFMIAATWADQIKRDPGYVSDGSRNGNRPDGSPDPGANRGYDDRLMHKYWHFVNVPFATDGTPLPPIPTPNASERIERLRGVLGSSADDVLKSYDLVWLLHLVGDVHQPLHGVTRVSAAELEGDDGGNTVRLDCRGCPQTLHAFWDLVPGAASTPREAIMPALTAARRLGKAPSTAVAKADAKQWIEESFQLSRQVVYRPPIGPGNGPFALTATYTRRAKAVAEERIALAGARLARLLNTELR
jgi:hypothetical protein